MRAQNDTTAPGRFLPVIENTDGKSPVILVCEHASNALPDPWGTLGLAAAQTRAHIAWDPGALGLARGLAARLDATLIHAPVSRLIYDCNRGPDRPGAMPTRSEVHDIPGNAAISPEERLARTHAVFAEHDHVVFAKNPSIEGQGLVETAVEPEEGLELSWLHGP